MGADGGSIPTRQELIGIKAPIQKLESDDTLFSVCSISKKPLNYQQLVCDYYGKLYNKEAVLEYLLSKKGDIPQLRSLKDIVVLNPHIVDGNWQCSLSNKSILHEHKSTKFAAGLCGHVLQASIFRQNCPLCNRSAQTIIILNAEGPDLARQKAALANLKKKRKLLKAKLKG